MKLAICSIQRNRAMWLKEWVTFHSAVGVDKFYLFLHRCNDNSKEEAERLKQFFDIETFSVPETIERPQLAAYKYCYENFNHAFDWVAFLDGDEFLFPTNSTDLKSVLKSFDYLKLSGLGVYWACFGSNYHLTEPTGLITQNYRKRAPLSFSKNRHIKSIVRGRQGEAFRTTLNSHIFQTMYGTYDTLMRPISSGLTEYEPTYTDLRINHYVTQSLEYFKSVKQASGLADVNVNGIRPDLWWYEHDRNDELDTSIDHIFQRFQSLYLSIN